MVREILRIRTVEHELKLEASKFVSEKSRSIEKTAVRIYSDEKIGIAGAIGKCDVSELESKAKEKLEFGLEYKGFPTENVNMTLKTSSAFRDFEDFKDEYRSLLDYLVKKHPSFLYSGQGSVQHVSVDLENEASLSLHHDFSYYTITFLLKRKDSASIADGYLWIIGYRYDSNVLREFLDGILKAMDRDIDLPREGSYRVVFLLQDSTPLYVFHRDLNALKFSTGGSLFSGKLGERLFSKELTIYQTRNPEDEATDAFFDSEGTFTEDFRFALVKNGVIVSPYTSKKYAVEQGYPLTGAAGGDFDSVPDVSEPDLRLVPTRRSVRDITGDEAIFVLTAAGGDFTPEGDFSSPVQAPLLYKNGEFVGKLPPLRISSNVWKMFGEDFVGVSEESLFGHPGGRLIGFEMEVCEEI